MPTGTIKQIRYPGKGHGEANRKLTGRLLLADPNSYPVELPFSDIPVEGPIPRIGDRVTFEYRKGSKEVVSMRRSE